MLSEKSLTTLPDYRNAFRKLRRGELDLPPQRGEARVACLSSFTTNGIEEILSVKSRLAGISTDFYMGRYNQIFNEIMVPTSPLYEFKPDVVILFMDLRTLCGDYFFSPYDLSEGERREWVKSRLSEINSLIDHLRERCPAKIILHNFEVPHSSPFGILENRQEYGFIESIEDLNHRLRELYRRDDELFLLDYNGFCAGVGKGRAVDFKMYYLGDVKLSWEHMPALCDAYLSYLKPILSLNRKCLVLDLDNTLWGGVVGEDGIEGIKLGPTPEGRSFWEMQKLILSLHNRGVILAVNSKNNPEDALTVIRDHPHMVLREGNFASIQINWNDKISNIKRIAEEINIGLDTLLFLDDDKLNREMVRDALPEVLVPDLPEDTSLYPTLISEIRDFDTLQITHEDRRRGRMYAEQRERREFTSSVSGGVEKYLRELKSIVTLERATPITVPRVSQLTLKTNQFNMTTRRYQQEEIKKFCLSENMVVITASVRDRFGDSGLSGVCILEKGGDDWRLDTFLLSCRILGRKIEEAIIASIIKMARAEGAHTLTGEFLDSGKNAPAKEFYKSFGFKKTEGEEEPERWVFDLAKEAPAPDYIKIEGDL